MEVIEKVMEFCGYIQEVYERKENLLSSSVFILLPLSALPIIVAHMFLDLVNDSQILSSHGPSTQELPGGEKVK